MSSQSSKPKRRKGAPSGFTALFAAVAIGLPLLGLIVAYTNGYKEFFNIWSLLYFFAMLCGVVIVYLSERGLLKIGCLTEFSAYYSERKKSQRSDDPFVSSMDDLNRLKKSGMVSDEQYEFYRKRLMQVEFDRQSEKIRQSEEKGGKG